MQPLTRAVTIDENHLCRSSDMKEAMVIDMRTKGIFPDFRGTFEVIVDLSVGGKGKRRSTKNVQANAQLKIQDRQV